MNLLNPRVWWLSSRQLCGGEDGYSSFFVQQKMNPLANSFAF